MLCKIKFFLKKTNLTNSIASLCWLVQTLVAAYPRVEDTDRFSPPDNIAPHKFCPECDSMAQQYTTQK